MYKTLNGKAVVSAELLSKAKTEDVEAFFNGNTLPVKVVPSFTVFSGLKTNLKVLENLEDSIAYAGIEVTAEVSNAIKVLLAVTETVAVTLLDTYPWANGKSQNADTRSLTFNDTVINDYHYRISVEDAKRIWEEAKPVWERLHTNALPLSTIPRSERKVSGSVQGRTVTINKNGFTIGCQNVDRYYLEEAAKHYDW